jgi:acyl transferase domain-containing protein
LPAGYLDDIDCFDSLLFHISPTDARRIDPQERLLLEVARECLENAGYSAANLTKGRRVGVFVGAMWNDYQDLGVDALEEIQSIEATSIHPSRTGCRSFSI